MEVHFNPDLQARLKQLANETGRSEGEFVLEAMAEYLDELERIRGTLDRRYDDVKSGKVKLLNGEEAFARLRAKSEARRNSLS